MTEQALPIPHTPLPTSPRTGEHAYRVPDVIHTGSADHYLHIDAIDPRDKQPTWTTARAVETEAKKQSVRARLEEYKAQNSQEFTIEESTTTPTEEATEKLSFWQKVEQIEQKVNNFLANAVRLVKNAPQMIWNNRAQILEEVYAAGIGVATKLGVIATGTAVFLTVGATSIAAIPLAAVGVAAAAATTEIYKNRHQLFGLKKKDTREDFEEKYGVRSFLGETTTDGSGRAFFHKQMKARTLQTEAEQKKVNSTNALRVWSRFAKDKVVEHTFDTTESKEIVALLHQFQSETAEQTLAKVHKFVSSEHHDLTLSEVKKLSVDFLIQTMQSAKYALDTAPDKDTRQNARAEIKNLYTALQLQLAELGESQAETIDAKDKRQEHTAYKLSTEQKQKLKALAKDNNEELNKKAKVAAQRLVFANMGQQLVKYATGVKIAEALHNVWNALSGASASLDTPTAYAADRPPIPSTPVTSEPLKAVKVEPVHSEPLKAVKVPTEKPTLAAHKVAIGAEPTEMPAPRSESVDIVKGQRLFEVLDQKFFETENLGSGQQFLDRVAPGFIDNGRLSPQELAALKEVLSKKPDMSAERLRWEFGSDKFDDIFMLKPGKGTLKVITESSSSVQHTVAPVTAEAPTHAPLNVHLQQEELGYINRSVQNPRLETSRILEVQTHAATPLQTERMVQTKINSSASLTAERVPAPQSVPAELEAQAVTQPQTEALPAITTRRIPAVEAVPVAPPVLESRGVQPIPEQLKSVSFKDLKIDENLKVSTNQENVFKFTNEDTMQIKDWIRAKYTVDPPVDRATYDVDEMNNIVMMYMHSARSLVKDVDGNPVLVDGKPISKAQIMEWIRQQVEGGYKNSPRLTEVQVEANMHKLVEAHTEFQFTDEHGVTATYELIDAHYLNHFDMMTKGPSISSLAEYKDSLLITYCGRAHVESFKMLSLDHKIPADLTDNLEVIRGEREGNLKQAIQEVTDWFKEAVSRGDTQTALEHLKEKVPGYLKKHVDVLLDPNADPTAVQSSTEAIYNWLAKYDKDTYTVFRLLYDANGNNSNSEWMKNFKDYISFTRHTLVFHQKGVPLVPSTTKPIEAAQTN